MNNNFDKVHTVKDLIISILMIGAGIGLCFLNRGLGITIFIAGVLCLIFLKSGFRDPKTTVVLSKSCAEADKKCRQSIIDFISGLVDEPEIVRTGTGAVVRIEIYHNLEEGVAYVQLYDFVDYNYVASGELTSLDENRAALLLNKMSSAGRNC